MCLSDALWEEQFLFLTRSRSIQTQRTLNSQHFSLWSKSCSLSAGVFIGSFAETVLPIMLLLDSICAGQQQNRIHSGREGFLSVPDSLPLHSNVAVLSEQNFSLWSKSSTLRTNVLGNQSSTGDIFHRVFQRRKSSSFVVYRICHCAVTSLSDNSIRGRTASVKDPMICHQSKTDDLERRHLTNRTLTGGKSPVSLVSAAFEWSGSESRTEAVLPLMRHFNTIVAE